MSKGPGPGGSAASSAPPAATAQVLQAQPEKPQHYTYLKEFRTEQCPLFVQHKCTQHRPYTCFHWHFVNQRRRRSIRRRDGTFNYSPDVYCTKYDEATGLCPEGDECPFLHRTTGDTERRYHLRYYKTGICIHETDSKGNCTKNGLHCAFAHGPHDLRSPVYDIRELQAMEALQNGQTTVEGSIEGPSAGAASHAMIEKILSEEPRWQGTGGTGCPPPPARTCPSWFADISCLFQPKLPPLLRGSLSSHLRPVVQKALSFQIHWLPKIPLDVHVICVSVLMGRPLVRVAP